MFKGIITPIVTPFHRDGQQTINYEATDQLIDALITKGVNGIFILGSNGEFHVLSVEEKLQFAEHVIRYVNHRLPVFVGTGACSTNETIYLSQAMEKLGADALSVITPYFIKPTDEELFEHFKAVAASVQLPIVLYNIPKSTGVNISAALVARLSEIANIKGIKDSSGDEANLQAYIAAAKKNNMAVLVGSDSKISVGYKMGATGAIAGTSNLITETLVGLFASLEAGDEQKAAFLQKDIDVLRDCLKLGTVPSILKRAVELAKIAPVGPARRPVLEPSESVDEAIKVMLAHYGFAV